MFYLTKELTKKSQYYFRFYNWIKQLRRYYYIKAQQNVTLVLKKNIGIHYKV